MKDLRRKWNLWVLRLLAITLVMAFYFASQAIGAPIYTASYYTVNSCMKESGQAIMANGRKLDDSKFTCASWDHKFGKKLRITNLANGKSVVVEVTDHGPARRLYRRGRIIDLSRAAFSAIADLKQGIIQIEITNL